MFKLRTPKLFPLAMLLFMVSLMVTGCATDTQRESPRVMMLEIFTDPSGPIYPPEKTLTLRVFSDKHIEFDYYPDDGPDRVGIPFSSELRWSKISEEQLNEINDCLELMSHGDQKTIFGPTKPILDASIMVKVIYRSGGGLHELILSENDSSLHLEKAGVYPGSLARLLSLAQEINLENLDRVRKEEKTTIPGGDESEIYNKILAENRGHSEGAFLIQNRTESFTKIGNGIEDTLMFVKKERNDVAYSDEPFTDFQIKNSGQDTGLPPFDPGHDNQFIDHQTVTEIFENGDGWQKTGFLYSSLKTLVTFSQIGFDSGKTQAIVYAGFVSGPKSGKGFYYLLRKDAGRWQITGKVNVWES